VVDAVSRYAFSAYVRRNSLSGAMQIMHFQAKHLGFLRECRAAFDPADEMAGGVPAGWFGYVSSQTAAETLPSHRCKRADLFQYASSEPRIELVAAAILAWGGMHRQHGQQLFERQRWLELAQSIREGEVSRGDAYDAFASLRADGELPGMGPAYFTKLIFFLMPRSKPVGYIMDQWTACSINILLDDPSAVRTDAAYSWSGPSKLSSQYVVSDHNSADQYERFCRAIEALAAELELAPGAMELLLLSEGGRKPLPWREYVKQQRRPALTGLAA
jgi:hypothetical protein